MIARPEAEAAEIGGATGEAGPLPSDVRAAADLLLSVPTLAQAAFWVIVVTFVGVLLAAVIGDAPILMEPIVLSLLLLPARAVLSNPDKQRAAQEDPEATRCLRESGAYDRLLREIDALAAHYDGLKRPIGLIIARHPLGVHAAGSWRRDYLIMGRLTAKKLAAELKKNPASGRARTLLLHELAHIAHRDQQRVGFAGELLRGSVTILPWWILFLTFWLGMAIQGIAAALSIDFTTLPGVPSELGEMINSLIMPDAAARAAMLARAESINLGSLLTFIFLSFLPIAMTGGILYLFFWRWMVRLQEHYADIATIRRGATPFDLKAAMGMSFPLTNKASGHRALGRRLFTIASPAKISFGKPALRSGTMRNFFRLHPTLAEREAVLASPELLYSNWKRVAWSGAVLSVGLDVILSSPLFAYHGLTLQLYMATAFLLISTWLLPQLIMGRPVARDLGRVLLVITGVRAAWLALNIALLAVQVIFFPAGALGLLNALVIASSRYTGNLAAPPVLDPLEGLTASFAAILLEGLQIGGLLAAVALYVWWMRRASPTSTHSLKRRHWWAVLIITVVVYAALWPVARLIIGA